MALLDVINTAGGGEIVRNLAAGSSLEQSEAEEALAALLPEVGRAIRRAGESRSGAAAVHALMQDERYRRYFESPTSLAEPAAAADGERVLDEVLDDDERSELVRRVAAAIGPDEGEVRALLPRVAALAVAVLGQRLRDPSPAPPPSQGTAQSQGSAPSQGRATSQGTAPSQGNAPSQGSAPSQGPEIPWFGTRQGDHFDAPLLNALARLFEADEDGPPERG